MGCASDNSRQNPRTSVYTPDLDLTFSVPSDLASGGVNTGQAEQMALSRAPVVVDPPWKGKPGHNQHGDPFPYVAAQALTRGESPEGYAVHHLGRVLPPDEQPQPATPRATSLEPSLPTAGPGTPRESTEPTAPDLQALGDYMAVRLSGRSAQDALDLSASENRSPRGVRQILSRSAAWYQDHHDPPQDPAAAAALLELLDPVARLQALGSRKSAVSPPTLPPSLFPSPPTASFGRSRSPSPTPPSAAATFLGPRMSALAHPGRASAFDGVASTTRAARPPSLNPAPSPLLARGIPGMAPPRDHYAGAYSDPPVDTSQGNLPDANTRALQSIARSLNEREDATTQERGKVGSIGKVEERCVYYARACDNFHVSLCSGVLGRTAFNALRNIASQGRSLMKTIQFPVNISNRIAYGMSALAIGGRCHLSAAEWSLGTSDFPQTSEEQFDSFRPSNGNTLEKKPRHATTLLAWHRDALRMSLALACFFGEEWYAQWEEAANYLLKLSEQHEYAWPADAIFGAWAELWNHWCEELREIDRRFLRELREEAPSYDRIRFFLTAPGADGTPWLRLPRLFDLEDPDEYVLQARCDGPTNLSSQPRLLGGHTAETSSIL